MVSLWKSVTCVAAPSAYSTQIHKRIFRVTAHVYHVYFVSVNELYIQDELKKKKRIYNRENVNFSFESAKKKRHKTCVESAKRRRSASHEDAGLNLKPVAALHRYPGRRDSRVSSD